MAASSVGRGSQPVLEERSSQGKPTDEQISHYFDLSIALILARWAALTFAVQNGWGGPDSSDKRDWLAGAISDLFAERPDTDAEDVEDVLLQVMGDEFDVQLDDGSEIEVARDILKARKATLNGEFGEVEAWRRRWADEQSKKGKVQQFQLVAQDEDDEDDEEDDDESEEENGGVSVDIDMDEAPPLVAAQGKPPPPEVDEEGFTKVVSKRRR